MQVILDKATTAYQAALSGNQSSFTEDGVTRQITRQGLKVLRDEMNYWQAQINRANSGNNGIATKFITPII